MIWVEYLKRSAIAVLLKGPFCCRGFRFVVRRSARRCRKKLRLKAAAGGERPGSMELLLLIEAPKVAHVLQHNLGCAEKLNPSS